MASGGVALHGTGVMNGQQVPNLEAINLKGWGRFNGDCAGFDVQRYFLPREWDYVLGDERLFWRDADNDTYGVGEESIRACEAPDGYAAQAGDCNDGDPTIHPDAPDDQCNGVDNDCVDGPDSDLPIVTRYADGDGDGWGVDTETSAGCLPSEGWAEQAGDCDDARDAVHPDAPEVCDGLDNDCADGPDDGLWGSGAACPADSCADLKARLPSTTSGTFWLHRVRPAQARAAGSASARSLQPARGTCPTPSAVLRDRAPATPALRAA